MSLVERVAQAFAPGGALTQATDQFHPRTSQSEMAQAVAETIEAGGELVVEAGTGVGKTFSYLVPALLSGERVLLSTATKTLQDQLYGRDLPRLAQALGVPVRMALLKGRASYLCLHRLETARQSSSVDRVSQRVLARIEDWARTTRCGDLAELSGVDDRSPVIPLVTSTRENCLGAQCTHARACHVNNARREALAAEVVVVNHHLFFADLAVRESGMAELLPTVRVAIFDEAHQLNEIGVQFLGAQFGTGQLVDFARDTLGAGLQFARGLVDWQQVAGGVERAARDLRLAVGRTGPQGQRLRWADDAPEGCHPQDWQEALEQVGSACTAALQALDTVSEIAPDFARLADRARALADRAARFQAPCAAGCVRWVDAGQQLRLVESPLDIAGAVREKLLRRDREESSSRSFIFTSATLGDDARLSWFTQPCGLDEARVLRVGSPFDYASQAALYVPGDFPRPADPSHPTRVADLAARAAARIGGRCMVLTTTLRSLRAIGEMLQARFGGGERIEVLVQGQWTKRRLIERFREGSSQGRPGCVLVASASFWEGVDVPGDQLQLVIIDKLPFPPPGDPLVEARTRRIEALGRSPFNDYHLPEAAVALKQGAGRLIRSESDRGVLVVCDQRLSTMGYGRRLLACLPPMRRLHTEVAFSAALDGLAPEATRSATTDVVA